MYTVKAFRVSGLFCHLPAGQSVISASNVFTDSHVFSGPALEVVAELGHRAFLPCSLSSPQVLSIIFLNLKTVSLIMASNPISPPHFKAFQRMNEETYMQNIFKYHSCCIIDLVRHKHHNFNRSQETVHDLCSGSERRSRQSQFTRSTSEVQQLD